MIEQYGINTVVKQRTGGNKFGHVVAYGRNMNDELLLQVQWEFHKERVEQYTNVKFHPALVPHVTFIHPNNVTIAVSVKTS